MTEKIYKNKNMIREVHHVGRVIRFKDELERTSFKLIYGDEIPKIIECKFKESPALKLVLPKLVFDKIVLEIGLVNEKYGGDKTRCWRTRKALA